MSLPFHMWYHVLLRACFVSFLFQLWRQRFLHELSVQFRIMVSRKWDVLIALKESLLSGRLSSGQTYDMKGKCSWTYVCFPVGDKCSCQFLPSNKPQGSFELPLAAGSQNPVFFLVFTYLSSFSVLSITSHSRSSLSLLWPSPARALPSLVRSLACKESHLRFF